VNCPSTLRDEWASCFTATCLLLRRVRSLTVAPHVYSQVPYEVFMSYTDNANILLLSLISKPLKMVWFYAPFYKKPPGWLPGAKLKNLVMKTKRLITKFFKLYHKGEPSIDIYCSVRSMVKYIAMNHPVEEFLELLIQHIFSLIYPFLIPVCHHCKVSYLSRLYCI